MRPQKSQQQTTPVQRSNPRRKLVKSSHLQPKLQAKQQSSRRRMRRLLRFRQDIVANRPEQKSRKKSKIRLVKKLHPEDPRSQVQKLEPRNQKRHPEDPSRREQRVQRVRPHRERHVKPLVPPVQPVRFLETVGVQFSSTPRMKMFHRRMQQPQ